jgi:glycosyltransferase involved in cell wall biosynthesis
MHSGLCVITTNNWDEDKFIEDGVNGFFVGNNSEEILNLYENLDRSMVEVVGKAGQETAKKVFGLKKYRKAWLKVIKDVT